MTRKRLPKAITRTSEDLQEINAGAVTSEQRKGPEERSVSKPPPDEEVAASQSASPHDTAEGVSAPAASPPAITGELLSPVSIYPDPQAARRRAVARKIVERHKMYAAMGGLFSLPFVNVAGVTAINVRMVKALSDLYGVPFERELTRSIIMGLVGGAVPSGLAAATASTIALVFPASGLVGLAVSSLTAATLTRGIGRVFVEHLESEVGPPGFSNGEN